jgi:hypothetical protein
MNVFVLCATNTSTVKKIEWGSTCFGELVVRRLNLQLVSHINLPLV